MSEFPARISPRAPASAHFPAVALLGLLLILTISHVYLQLAFPLHGAAMAAGAALLWTALLFLPGGRPQAALAPAGAAAFALWALWTLWSAVELWRAPVAAFGRPVFTDTLLGLLVFWIAAGAALRWRGLPEVARAGGGGASAEPRLSLSAAQVWALWLAILGAALAAFGVYQTLGPEGWPKTFATLRAILLEHGGASPGALHALGEERAFGTFGAPNIYAGFLIPPLAICCAAAGSRAPRRSTRLLAAGGAALILWALFLSQSRGGFLAAAAALAFLALRMAWLRIAARGAKSAPPSAGAASALFIPVLFYISFSIYSTPLEARAQGAYPANDLPELRREIVERAARRGFLDHLTSSSTIRQRLYYWETGLDIWNGAAIAGRGLGAYETFYPRYRRPGAGETTFAHNWIVQFGCERGIVGLTLFTMAAAACFALGARAIRAARRRAAQGDPGAGASAAVLLAIEAGALGLLLHGLLDYTLSHRELYLGLMGLFGVLAGSGIEAAEADTAEKADGSLEARPVPSRRKGRGLAGWTARAALAAAVWAALAMVAIPSQMSRFYSIAAGDHARDAGPDAQVLEFYRKALRWEPDHPRPLASLAMTYFELGDLPRAQANLERALAANPHSASLQSLMARLRDAQGRPAEALEAARLAVARHPLEPNYRLDLTERLVAMGKIQEAQSVLGGFYLPSLNEEQKTRLATLRQRLAPSPAAP